MTALTSARDTINMENGRKKTNLILPFSLALIVFLATKSVVSTAQDTTNPQPRNMDHLPRDKEITAIKNYLTILFILLNTTLFSHSQAQWLVEQVPTTQRLTDVYFGDTLNGWVCGLGGIYHTTDGGTSWILQDSAMTEFLGGVNTQTCWATTEFQDTLLFTTDGGTHWGKRWLGIYPDTTIKINSGTPFFADSLTGWIPITGGKVLKTTDGGQNWNETGTLKNPYHDTPRLIWFADKNHGWVGGYLTPINQTFDGGSTWDSIALFGVGDQGIIDMQIVNERIGWVSSPSIGVNTELIKTTDSGRTWFTDTLLPLTDIATRIRFTDTSNGWFAQYTGMKGIWHTEIVNTTDGGRTWVSQFEYYPTFIYEPTRIYFTDKLHGWISGFHGVLLHTTNGGTTSVDLTDENLMKKNFNLMQNYPNPFNPSTTIKFELHERNSVELVIYNMQGIEIKTLVHGIQEAGITTVVWNGDDKSHQRVPSGTYLCLLRSLENYGGVLIKSRKVLVLR